MIKKDKLRIEVFVPFGSCVCEFAPFMEKIGNVTSKFKDSVEVQMKSTKSQEASKYGVQGLCVIVGGTVKLSADFDEKELEEVIIKEEQK
jgi:hypothetical protein